MIAASSTGAVTSPAPAPFSALTGRVNEKVLPLPISLSTQMRPPWCSTISLQIGRPSPVPFGLSVSVRDPEPRVDAAHDNLAVAPHGAARDRPHVRELDGVRDQVDHHLDQPI